MIQIGLRDGMFPHAYSMSTGGETLSERPKYFEWNRVDKLPVTFYTDHCIPQVADDDWSVHKIALLIEAPKFRPLHYALVQEYEHHFDYILTYHLDLLETKDQRKWLWYPRGGSYIPEQEWWIREKSKMFSFLASDKRGAMGHEFRHGLWREMPISSYADCFGPITGGDVVPKSVAFGDYYFSVIVPGERQRGLFCDHIIDCFAFGTIPIYWRELDVTQYFDARGIITFDTIEELKFILNEYHELDYYDRLNVVKTNIDIAKQYRIAEDWLWRNRRYLFEV